MLPIDAPKHAGRADRAGRAGQLGPCAKCHGEFDKLFFLHDGPKRVLRHFVMEEHQDSAATFVCQCEWLLPSNPAGAPILANQAWECFGAAIDEVCQQPRPTWTALTAIHKLMRDNKYVRQACVDVGESTGLAKDWDRWLP